MKKSFKVLSLVFVSMMLMAALLAGCQTSAPATTLSVTKAAETKAAETKAAGTKAAETKAVETAAAVEPTKAGPAYTVEYYMLCNAVSEDVDKVEEVLNKIIEPKINAKINITMADWGGWGDKVTVRLNAGEKIDVCFTANWWGLSRDVAANLFLPLNDPKNDLMAKFAPDTIKALGERFVLGSQIDGINYAIPTNKELCVPNGFLYNRKIAKELGITFPEKANWDYIFTAEFSEAIAKVKAKYPKMFPLLGGNGGPGSTSWTLIDPGVGYEWTVMYNDNRDTKIYNKADTAEFEANIRGMRKYYQAAYVNPDAVLTTWNEGDVRKTGEWFINWQPLKGNEAKANELEIEDGGGANRDYGEVQTGINITETQHVRGSMLAIPVTSGNPEKAMMLINEMHTNPDFNSTMLWGVEGIHYKKTATAGVVEKVPDNKWNGVTLPWTLGNQFNLWISSSEDPLKYKKLYEFGQTGKPHVSMGFSFIPVPVENELAALNNAMTKFTGWKIGAFDPDTVMKEIRDALKVNGNEKVLAEAQKQFDVWYAKYGKK